MQKRMIDALRDDSRRDAVGLVDRPPLHMAWNDAAVFTDQTTDLRPSNAAAEAVHVKISPGYFHAAGTALLAGRTFTWHDDKNAPRVAVVNREFAQQDLWLGNRRVGRYFKMTDGTRIQVVGIVEDGKYTRTITEDPQPAMFLPILQSPGERDVAGGALECAIRSNWPRPSGAQLRDLDRGLPRYIADVEPGTGQRAVCLAHGDGIAGRAGRDGRDAGDHGIFGMAAYSVSKRLRELGIRIALGAQRKEVLRAALGRAFRLLAFGSAAGLLLGILATRCWRTSCTRRLRAIRWC